jgi:hypothetical protein
MTTPDNWSDIDKALTDANPVPPGSEPSLADARRDRMEQVLATGRGRRWRMPRAFGVAAAATGAAALVATFAFLIVAAPDGTTSGSASGLTVRPLDDPTYPRLDVGYDWPQEDVDDRTAVLVRDDEDLALYLAKDTTGKLVCLLADPKGPNQLKAPLADAWKNCHPRENLAKDGLITAGGLGFEGAIPPSLTVFMIVPDSIETIAVGGRQAVVTNNVARIDVPSGGNSVALLGGPGALKLRETIDAPFPQPPLDEDAPQAAALSSPDVVGAEPLWDAVQVLTADVSCRIDPWTLTDVHRSTSGSTAALRGDGGTEAVILMSSGPVRSACVGPDEPARSPKRIITEYGIDTNLVAGVAPDGYTKVRAGNQVRDIRTNMFLIEFSKGIIREVTLTGPAGEITLPVPPREPPVPVSIPTPAPEAPTGDLLSQKLPLLRSGDLGRPRETVTLRQLQGRPAYLIFVAPRCARCDERLATLAEDARREFGANVRPVVVIVGRDAAGALDVRDRSEDGDTPIVRDPDGITARGFGVNALPAVQGLTSEGNNLYVDVPPGELPLSDALLGATAAAAFSGQIESGCRPDPATTRLAGRIHSGDVRAYTAATSAGKRAFVFLESQNGYAIGTTAVSCALKQVGEATAFRADLDRPWIGGSAPEGYTRVSVGSGGPSAPVVDGVVLVESLPNATEITLTGPAGRLVVPMEPRTVP